MPYIELAIVVALILLKGLLVLAELAIVSPAALDCRRSSIAKSLARAAP
jgi:hypothetical protein